jgi:predicted ArsR family transcriptional regulator
MMKFYKSIKEKTMPFHIQRFMNNLQDHTDKGIQEQVLQGLAAYDTLTTPVKTARWIKMLVENLTDIAGEDIAKDVMEACGQQCMGQNLLVKAWKLQKQSQDIDDLLIKLNDAHIGGGKLHREGDIIYASYERCYCGSVSKTRQPISLIYCQCSCGWYKQLFEAILDRSVKVELLDSIIHGADTCQFIIHI